MNILTHTTAFFANTIRRIQRAANNFISATQRERDKINASLETSQNFFENAGANGLAFLLLSNVSVAASNLLVLLEELTPEESLRIAHMTQNLANSFRLGYFWLG